MRPVIEVSHLSKSFGSFHAVRDLSFTVNQGDVYGFLGQNGAGKSTTIRMLLTLIRPDAGEIRILGMDLSRNRENILRQTGAVIERPDLYSYLTALDNLSVFAKLSGLSLPRAALLEKLDHVGLADRALSKVRTFSQGMKQRLGIAVALVHDPSVIILDEPTNGLDPQGIADMRRLIRSLSRDAGKTLLVSSHLLGEMEQIATRMIIIHKGARIVEGEVRELIDPAHVMMEVDTTDQVLCAEWIGRSPWAANLKQQGGPRLMVWLHRSEIPDFTRALAQAGHGILSLRPQNTLEEYFLSITSGETYAETD